MPSPATGTALLILVAFVLPGFVTILVKERIYEVASEREPFERVLNSLYYSLLIYAVPVMIAALAGVNRQDLVGLLSGRADLRLTVVLALALWLLIPVFVAYAARRWDGSKWRTPVLEGLKISTTHRNASSWDYMFEDGEPALIRATLKDGSAVVGYYGRRSHSGYESRRRDLFLEERWQLSDDGTILESASPNTLGVWLNADDLVAVERYAVESGQADVNREAEAGEQVGEDVLAERDNGPIRD